MSQNDLVIANQSFPSFRTDLNSALQAIFTTHSGTSLPSGASAGLIWLDTTSATAPILKYYDGVDNITLATINHTANTVDFNDSAISTPLAVTGNATAGAELRLPEDTDNGSNYVAIKAPDTIASNLTLTLPSADGTNGQALVTNGSGVLSFASAGTSWQSVQTTGFTASAGKGYPCNTTSSAFTVTLPASPSVGDYVQIVDYAGTFATNNITLGANSNKINGVVANKILTTNREAVTLVYVDSTQGWVSSSGANEGTQSIDPLPYSIDFLVIGGGGSGGQSASSPEPTAGGGGGGGAGGFRTSTQSSSVGTLITVTVGDGGATGNNSGSASSISGSGLTTISSAGGGNGGGNTAVAGGSGGGGSSQSTTGASGNTPSTSPSQGSAGGNGFVSYPNSVVGGGGGGAGAVGGNGTSPATGGNGGNGTASSITGSSVTYAGGGGGGARNATGSPSIAGTGGTGGGGRGGQETAPTAAVAGTVNTGGGGGGNHAFNAVPSGAGGKGVVILSVPTASYSGTSSGSPTITTSGSNTILKFTGTGSYTA